MNGNIDLGTFEFDTKKISDQIAENSKLLQDFNTQLKQSRSDLKLSVDKVNNLSDALERQKAKREKLKKELEAGKLSEESYNEKLKSTTESINRLENNLTKAQQVMAGNANEVNNLQQSVKRLRQENNMLNKLIDGGINSIDDSTGSYKKASKELEALKLRSKDLGFYLNQLSREGKENTDEFRALSKEYQNVTTRADELNDELKELDKAVGDNHRSVGDYKDQIKGAFSEIGTGISQLKNGDIPGAFATIKTGVNGAITSIRALSVAMLSNPITAVLVAIAAAATGVALAFKEIWDYNEEQLPKIQLLQNKFGDLGADSDELRIKINALEETFGLSFERIADTVDSVSSAGLGSQLEAVDAIMKGIATTDNVDNFLSKLDLAASKARQTGMNLDEVLNLTKALQGTAIDPNTIYGGLEKATARLQMGLNENKALVNNFGEVFAKDLLQKVQSGSITTVQALSKIQEQSEKNNISIAQQADLGKDLFGKLAANAGAYNEMMRLVDEAHKDQYANLTDLQKATIEYSEANVELAKAKDEALKSDSLIAFQEQWKILWTKAKTLWYIFVKKITEGIQDIEIGLRAMAKIFSSVFTAPKKIIESLARDFQDLANVASKMGDVIEKALSLDFSGAKKSFGELKNIVNTGFKNTKASAYDIANSIKSAYSDASKYVTDRNKGYAKGKQVREELENKKVNENSNVDVGNVKTKQAKKAKDDAQKKLEEETKKALELQKEASEQSIKQAQLELAEYIRINAEKLKDEKRLTSEKLKLQNEYLKEIEKKQLDILSQEQALKEKVLQVKIDELNKKKSLNNNEKQELKNLTVELANIREEFAQKRISIEENTQKQIAENDKTFEKQRVEDEKLSKAIEFQQKILDLEEQGATEYEVKQAQAEEQKRTDLEKLEEDRENGLISLENYDSKKQLIEEDYANKTKQINKEVEQSKIDGFSTVLGQMKSAFGEQTALGKASAIAETVINTYKSATSAYSSLAGIPVVGPALGAAAASAAVIAGLKSVQKITSVQTPKAQKGMLIQGKSHANGGVPILTPSGMIEAEGGEVIINKISSSLFRDVLSDINVAGGGVKFARGGVTGGKLASVQNRLKQGINNAELVDAVKTAVFEGSIAGTQKGSQQGIGNLRTNTKTAVKSLY